MTDFFNLLGINVAGRSELHMKISQLCLRKHSRGWRQKWKVIQQLYASVLQTIDALLRSAKNTPLLCVMKHVQKKWGVWWKLKCLWTKSCPRLLGSNSHYLQMTELPLSWRNLQFELSQTLAVGRDDEISAIVQIFGHGKLSVLFLPKRGTEGSGEGGPQSPRMGSVCSKLASPCCASCLGSTGS